MNSAPPPADPFDVTEDAALGGRLRLKQLRRGHRFGHDAVLLAAAVDAQPGEHVVEFGAGVGFAGLAVALRAPGARAMLLDVDPALVALAAENAARNGMGDRVRAAVLDVGAPAVAWTAAGLPPACADRVLMNPPFHDQEGAQASPDAARARAHVGPRSTLTTWTATAARLLVPAGTLALIWRADGLADVLAALVPRFGGISVVPIYPRPDSAAIRIVATGAKGSRAPLQFLPGLVLNGHDGRPTPEAEAVLRDGALLREAILSKRPARLRPFP